MKTKHFCVLLFIVSSCTNSPNYPDLNYQEDNESQENITLCEDTVPPDTELVVSDSDCSMETPSSHIDLPCTHGYNSSSDCPICSTRGILCTHGYDLQPYNCPLCSSEKYRSLSEEEQKEVERIYNQRHARDRINEAISEIEFQQAINNTAKRLIK